MDQSRLNFYNSFRFKNTRKFKINNDLSLLNYFVNNNNLDDEISKKKTSRIVR